MSEELVAMEQTNHTSEEITQIYNQLTKQCSIKTILSGKQVEVIKVDDAVEHLKLQMNDLQSYHTQRLKEIKQDVHKLESFSINTGDFGNTQMVKKSDILTLLQNHIDHE